MEGEPEAYKDESLRSIGISPRERLANIEDALEKIDAKLDLRFDAVEARLVIVEMSQTRCLRTELDVAAHAGLDHHYGATTSAEFKQLSALVDSLRIRVWTAIGGVTVLVFVLNFGLSKGWF